MGARVRGTVICLYGIVYFPRQSEYRGDDDFVFISKVKPKLSQPRSSYTKAEQPKACPNRVTSAPKAV